MLFSDVFKITRKPDDDWFDLFLNSDTELFIDPFLIYDNEFGHFIGSHAEIVSFFNYVLTKIARSGGNQRSESWLTAFNLLMLPEVEEICLGYTALGTKGSGQGKELAKYATIAMNNAIQAGLKNLEHFEEIQLFGNRIGADRISDATANIIRHRLAAYTQEVCKRHNIPLEEMTTDRGFFDQNEGRWINSKMLLPKNPINGKPILLVPRQYLRHLPTVNADAFWDYCFDNHNEDLRRKFGNDIKRKVDKQKIIELALENLRVCGDFLAIKQSEEADPYDIENDHNGLYTPQLAAYWWAKKHPKRVAPQNDKELADAIEIFIGEFKLYVEENTGWQLLWNDNGTPRSESTFQSLFMQTVAVHCRANGVDVNKEANIGRGPVDFKMSFGHQARVLVEAKLARNTKFWHGLQKQLPTYLKAEGVSEGIFIVCIHDDSDLLKVKDIRESVDTLNKSLPFNIRVILVNALKPVSASKVPNYDPIV